MRSSSTTNVARGDARHAWDAIGGEALMEPGLLARVLAATDLIFLMSTTWGRLPWFQPPYVRRPAGAVDWEFWARLNCSLRDYEAHLLRLPGDPWRPLALETFQGSWRTYDGANRGGDLISLCAWRWDCRPGQAAHRVGHLIGIDLSRVGARHAG